MKRYLLSFGVIMLFTFYALGQKVVDDLDSPLPIPGGGGNAPEPLPSGSSSAPAGASSPAASASASALAKPAQAAGQYKDGTYVGSAADAYYGTVQVRAVIRNGRLSDVQLLDYPHDRNTSREINTQAMPSLVSRAISVQGAQIDTVSGATESSGAFRESLASALAQARP